MRNGFTMIPKAILDKRLSIEAIGLYTWLSANADKKGRVATSRADLSKRTGLSQQQVRTALSKLESTKLITKLSTKLPTKLATTLIVSFLVDYKDENLVNNQVSNQVNNQADNQPRAYKNDILFNHSIEEKEEKRNNLSNDKFKENFGKYDFSFVSDDMAETFFRWLSYRKELKKPFATQSTLRQNYNKLMKLADNSPEKARLIVEQSIERQWEGLFQLLEERKDGNSIGQILHDNSAEKYLNDAKWK